jgi:hypothetical protein
VAYLFGRVYDTVFIQRIKYSNTGDGEILIRKMKCRILGWVKRGEGAQPQS